MIGFHIWCHKFFFTNTEKNRNHVAIKMVEIKEISDRIYCKYSQNGSIFADCFFGPRITSRQKDICDN